MGKYFDGDGSRLAQLLDPTRQGSPLHQFRGEVTDEFRRLSERITAIEAGAKARAEERARGTEPHPSGMAAARTVATGARAVLWGGTAFAMCLILAVLISPTVILQSLGIGVLLCVLLSTGAAAVSTSIWSSSPARPIRWAYSGEAPARPSRAA